MIRHSAVQKTLSRRRFLQQAGLLGLGAAAYAACGGDSDTLDSTSLDRTIVIGDEDALLSGPGEPHAVRTDLADAQTGREERRVSLLAFHHFSDFRITDEESPARAEWMAGCATPSTEAFRPQETLSVQAADALIARANALSSGRATGRPIDFAIHTGNAADNAQFNELRWFVNVMDGGTPVYPDSGAIGYQGVQPFSPAPNYNDLLNQAQRQFSPVGLRYPWYSALGNRDVLVQGSVAPGERASRIATGAQKIMALGPDATDEACAGSQVLIGADSSTTVLNDPDTVVRSVGKDGNRRFLGRVDWVAEHFATPDVPGPAGHGFSPDSVAEDTAYYSFEVGPVAMIVLDTVNLAGGAAGSIGEGQFLWLGQELIARSSSYLDHTGAPVQTTNTDKLIIVASHHPNESLNNPFPGPLPEEPRYQGPALEALLHRFPNVVLHIAGHTLAHRVTAKSSVAGDAGYWEITTGSPSYWPMQGRLIEIVDNRDGTLSIISTVYDSAAPINPGDADDPTPDDGQNQLLLASVARQVAARDSLRDPDTRGLAASDRNAELVLRSPVDSAALVTPAARPDDLP